LSLVDGRLRQWVRGLVVAASLCASAFQPAAAAGVVDDFSHGKLDTNTWRTCQSDPSLIDFGVEPGTGRDYLIIKIDGKRGNVDTCTTIASRDLASEQASLGPRFFANAISMASLFAGFCPVPEVKHGEALIQRNELRFAPRDLYPALADDIWYSLTFRMQGYGGDSIPSCGSARWVIGQWKYRHMLPGKGSPFLAQRFDNGVLYLTVEDDGCRCMIAKAGGDPDFTGTPDTRPLLPVPPLKCFYSAGSKSRESCRPAHLRLRAADLATLTTLPDPKQDWVRMTYRIRAGGPQGARIDVYANGRFIVRAEGDIDPHLPGNGVKFKIGHYRDKIPVKAEMLLDEVCVSGDAKACEASITPRP